MSEGNRLLSNGNLSVLKGLLSDINDLRTAYAGARKLGRQPADRAVARVSAFLRDEAVQRSLDPELQSVRLSAAPRRHSDVSERLKEAEEQLGSYYGFSRREVRTYLSEAYSIAQPDTSAKLIDNCVRLAELVRVAHEMLVNRLELERVGWTHRLGRKRDSEKSADLLCFAIGTLVADALQRSAFPLSYFVATTHLSGMTS